MDALSETARHLIAAAMAEDVDPSAEERSWLRVESNIAGSATAIVPNALLHGASPSVAPSDKIGRYHVLEPIGQGAMGVVFKAYDPELQRAVALKLLSPRLRAGGSSKEGRQRLVAEARALAKLSHHNVTAIHDVGIYDDAVWLAMELVDGRDLAQWLRDRDPEVDEILRVFRDAARGLAAAHAAGLIHRDFKPSNVLVDNYGRARVSDFGLARVEDSTVVSQRSTEPSDLGPTEDGLTADGLVMGTPVYMAPEQHRGVASPAADQFSFFVALYEALYRVRPYTGTARKLLQRKRDGPPTPVKRRGPAWTWALIRRGLDPDPNARHGSMATVARALEGPARGRGRDWAIGGLAIALGAVALAGWFRPDNTVDENCVAAAHSVSDVWNDDTKSRLERVLVHGANDWTATSWTSTSQIVDRWASELGAAYERSCVARRVDATQSDLVYERQLACLGSRKRELVGWIDVLDNGGPEALAHAVEVAERLPRVDACSDIDALLSDNALPADPVQAEQVASLEAELVVAEMQTAHGRPDRALQQLPELERRARDLHWEPIIGRVQLAHAKALAQQGQPHDAVAMTKEALFRAQRTGDERLVAQAAAQLTNTLANKTGDAITALDWAHLAQASVARLGEDSDLGREVLEELAGALSEAGDHDKALAAYEVVLHRFGADDRDSLRRAATLTNYAAALDQAGRSEDARERLLESVAIHERALGPGNPKLSVVLANLATLELGGGQPERAQQTSARAVQLIEAVHGTEHPWLVVPLLTMGNALRASSAGDDAQPFLERACAIAEASYPSMLGGCLANLGLFYEKRGNFTDAIAVLERSLLVQEKRLGPTHPRLTTALLGLARARAANGQPESALTALQRMRALAERAGVSRDVALALHEEGKLLREKGRPASALGKLRESTALVTDDLDRAIVRLEEANALIDLAREPEALAIIHELERDETLDTEFRAEIRFAGARALWVYPKQRSASREQARRAIVEFKALGPGSADMLERAETWLAGHP